MIGTPERRVGAPDIFPLALNAMVSGCYQRIRPVLRRRNVENKIIIGKHLAN